jgi:hypothetical protein
MNFRRPTYNNSEQILKRQAADYLARQGCLPLYYHAPKRIEKAGKVYRLKSPYMPNGVPDLLVFYRGYGFMVEVKRPKERQIGLFKPKRQSAGKLSPSQEVFQSLARARHVPVYTVYSFDEVVQAWQDFKGKLPERRVA